MRDAKAWIFLVVGLTLATVTGMALYGLSQQVAAKAPAAVASAAVDVIVAKVDLPVRTVVTADMLSHKSFPADLAPIGVLTNDIDAIGLTTVAPISRGQALVAGQLTAAEGKKGASVTLPKGLVLVSFPTTDPLTVGGLVNVGDRVDLLVSLPVDNTRTSQTTLQNLEVLDIVGPTKEQPNRVTALVFAVDHQVALVLKYLRDAQASVDLAIRSRAETDLARTSLVDQSFVIQTYGFRLR